VFIEQCPAEIQTPAHWNLISHSVTALPHMLSPSSILPHLHLTDKLFKLMFDDNFHICMIYGIEIKSIKKTVLSFSSGNTQCMIKKYPKHSLHFFKNAYI
jgi:hypothetical protein